jgi:hypothetical protein
VVHVHAKGKNTGFKRAKPGFKKFIYQLAIPSMMEVNLRRYFLTESTENTEFKHRLDPRVFRAFRVFREKPLLF